MVLLFSNSIEFDGTKTNDGKAEVKWSRMDVTNKNFHYEVAVSRNRFNFTSVGSKEKNKSTDLIYKYLFSANGDDGFSIYPNHSPGIVGIKFDCIQSGKILVLITNEQGQSEVKKEFEVLDSSYGQIATLQREVLWLRLTDVTSHLSCVNQLFIK